MEFTDYNKIARIIESEVGKDAILSIEDTAIQPYFKISKGYLIQICNTLKSSPELYFDFLNCITAIDNGIEANTIDLIYHISSIPFGNSCILKLEIDRTLDQNLSPIVESISSIWKTADWHEREIYDFFGVQFNNHPDLRRILLPADWEGHPMRKDYIEQEFYHNIKVKY